MTAKSLIANPESVVARIQEHMHDARWREPIVLALGMISWKWSVEQRREVLQALLEMDDNLSMVIPRGPILFSQTLRDLIHEPDRDLIQKAAYALTAAAIHAPLSQRHLLMEHCVQMLESCSMATQVTTILALLKKEVPKPLASAPFAIKQCLVASYVDELSLSDRRVAEALFASLQCDIDCQEALPNNESKWRCDHALRAIVASDRKALPARLLPMKQFLSTKPKWCRAIARNPTLCRVFLSLYGGLPLDEPSLSLNYDYG